LIRLQLHYTYSKGTNFGANQTLIKNAEILDSLTAPDLDLFFALCECVDVADMQAVAGSTVK